MEEDLWRAHSGSKGQHWVPMTSEPVPFSPAISSSPPKSVQCALLPSPCLQMPLSQCVKSSSVLDLEGSVISAQRDSVLYRLKSSSAERFRRHSVDGGCFEQNSEPNKDKRFHPYVRQYSDGEPTGSSLCCYLREFAVSESISPEASSIADIEEQNAWTPLSTTIQPSMLMGLEDVTGELQNMPEEPPSYSSSTQSAYSTLSPLQQQFSGEYMSGELEGSSCYSYRSLSPQTSQDGSVQPRYPKPIYSYSILIFMALRNSRTGSLPVSEIYSFMTEHFPYFKTAPDGWKNSVRHNLSLNKCFEKVENKSGNASRKGCLWSLNPAKVEKMQEELQKWRRKDPVMVRRSMARPELLDHLLGQRPEKLKSHSAHLNNHTYPQLPRVTLPPPYTTSTAQRRLHYSYYSLPSQTVLQQLPYPPSSSQTSFYSAIPHQPSTRLPHRTSSLDYTAALQAGHGTAASMQELLTEAEPNCDIDTLNPSLTELQLHGHLWEELRDDSLAPDSLLVVDTSTTNVHSHHSGDCGRNCGSAGGEVSTAVTEAALQESVPDLYITGLCSSGFSGTDSMVTIHSAPATTPIPLL